MVVPYNRICTAAIVLFCLHKLVNRHRLNMALETCGLLQVLPHGQGYITHMVCVAGHRRICLMAFNMVQKGHKEGPLGPWLCFGHVLLRWIIFINHYG